MKFAQDGCSMFGYLRWDSSDTFRLSFLGFHVWELCFSLVSPLWESCYSIAFGWGMRPGRGGASIVLLFPFFLFIFFFLISTSPPLFSFLPSFFSHSFLICFFLSSFRLSPLSPSFSLFFSPYHTPPFSSSFASIFLSLFWRCLCFMLSRCRKRLAVTQL